MSVVISTPNFPANVFKLDNGLTIIHQYISVTPAVVIDVWVRAGAREEPDKWSGMAHFLEHMIFKGTEKLGPGIFDQIIENRGGIANAATSHDYAHFFITTAAQYVEEVVYPLAELLLRASIPESEFAREREVVLEEIRQSEDCVDSVGFQALMENVYRHHPYRRSVMGTAELLKEREVDEMRCFHNHHYQPENMAVVVIGRVEETQVIELVNAAFANFSEKSSHCPRVEIAAEPLITEVRRQEIYLPRLEQGRLTMAWLGPGVEQLDDAYGLDLLSILLADGRNSRLVRELREDLGLVQGIVSSFSLQQDSSLFTISAMLEPKDIPEVEARIGDQLYELLNQEISEVELARCQRLLCNDYVFSIESPGQLAGLYGYYFTIANPELAISYPEKIAAFQPQELLNLAKKYLSPNRYAVTALIPI
ncbi:MAG: insulinase family protein [Okeania sp. SIO2G4]|uniref:M16 family metallopeptidase n=1 Tax=unclassified Okeania TaxID=2634635 RepID=UPI0013BDCA6B|nr:MULTISPECIES: pitrilysin family protein [unclassified Okeania]NEP06409.1 insulinase family protein [Okeania sp. SIO4D6]NEP38425.1 insulinase family protein [Okeania sp. SIO2H7]NEP72454.1 insulinase family protein [Okeania sp. SIO2G5]NEP93115.1 insulinase family protein [Okeania sp. SIO2F5]NEQ93244.1 insulinase family protein [Okeania sp. SIO2G4]